MWGTTYTWTCAKSQTLSSGANTLNGVSWNSDQSGTYQNAGTKEAPIHVIQIGTNSSAQTLNLITSGISGTISSITVNCSSKDGKHTVVAKVGTSYTSTSKNTSGSLNNVSFTSINATGNITLTFTKGNGNLRVHSISVEYSSCTALGSINGSVSWSNGQATVSWDKLSNVDGTTPYAVSVSPSTGVTVNSIDLTGAKATCSVTGLTAGTAYTFTINAYGDASHCDKNQAIPSTAPQITVKSAPVALTGSDYAEGVSGGGTVKTFTVSGVGLTGALTFTAPTNFQVSTDNGSTWSTSGGSKTLAASGTLAETTIKARLVEGLSVGTYGGATTYITISGGGAAAVNSSVSITGTVSSACSVPTIGNPSLTSITGTTITVSCPTISGGTNCDVDEYGFIWKAGSAPTMASYDGKKKTGENNQSTAYNDGLSIDVANNTGTTYYIKAYAHNSAGNNVSSTALQVTPRSVTFNSNGGSDVATAYVNNGGTVSQPSNPTKTHYTFGGWYTDNGTWASAVNFSSTITADKTYYAKWNPVSYTITTSGLTNVAPTSDFPTSFTYTGSTTTNLNRTLAVDGDNFFLPDALTVTMGGATLTAGTDYTYNNSTGAFTFSAVITGNIVITASATAKLKSIAITSQPTTRKYLVGDVFSSTGAVVTATMGDGSTKAVTASATWTPAGALSAGTSQTVTASYTENGINQTATTTIDVYSVTVNKVDMDGNAIADAGVTASCSGRTLSQSVSTTNYKFNSWVLATASGTSLSTNTLTGTPTGNVVVNAKFHKPITVTWKVGSGAASGGTSEVKYGTAITALPSTPADNALASCGTNKFMGWSAAGELKGTGHRAPADLFNSTSDAGCAALTENTTYRAVFASSTSGAAANTVLFEEPFTGMTADTKPTSPGASATIYGGATITYTFSDGTGTSSGTTAIKNEALTYSGSAPEVMVGKKGTSSGAAGGKVVISGIPNGGASALTVSYTQNANGLSATASGTGYSGSTSGSSKTDKSFDVTVSSNADATLTLTFQATSTSNVRLDDIKVKVKTAGTTYADYQTGCCEAPGTALSVTSANSVATGGTVSLTSTGGNGGTVTWSVVNGTGSATVAGTTLTAGSIGTVTVKAHQDANTVLGTEYCAQDAEQAFTVVSSTVNVTGVTVAPTTKAIVPGETFDITPTISPSNATDKSVSWTSSASDKASVSSGTVTGVAAGTATITCTTTDGSKTATTAVTVYGFTVLAQDEDGTDISGVSGITASHSGKALSAGVGSTKYVFKTWKYATGGQGGLDAIPSATSTSTTLTGTPTGDVTVIAEFYKPRVIKWSVNGDDSYATGEPTTTVAYNGTISTVPTAPADNTLSCTNKFMGWSTKDAGTTPKTTSYYDDLFTNASGYTTNITAATTTFYAVFAEAETGAWTLDYSEETALSSSTDWGSYGTAYDYTASDGGTWTVKAYKNAGMQINTTKDASIKIPDCSGNITSIVITCSAAKAVGLSASDYTGSGDITYIAYGTDATSQTIDCSSKTATGGYIVPKGGSTSITKIVVNYGSTSNYVTECDANIVKVTYNANGGSTSCTNTTTDKTKDFTVCSTKPTRDYYTFAGWLCSADDEVYEASATIDDAVIDADFSLTAQWTPVSYNITYELDGGTNNVGNPATYNVTTATITLQDPTKGHDRFEGWYDNGSFTGDAITSIPLGSHDNITLYAKWTERHEIVFDADGETTTIYRADDEAMDASVAGQGSVPSDPSAPTACSSKVFVGWSESEIDDETNTRPGDLMKSAEGKVDEDKHYYAVWALRAGSPAPATYAGTGTFVKITSMSEVETDTYYVLRGIDGSTVNVMKNTISSGKMGTADDPVSENVITNPGVAIVWKLGGKKDAYTLYNQSVSKYVEITGNSTGGYALNASPTSGATYTLTIEDGHGFFFKSNYSTANSRGISIYNDSEFRSYGLTNAKTLELYKLPAYTYSAYSTSCCETKVNLTQNSPEHGTVEFGRSSLVTCGSDKNVSLTIIPDVGYQLTGWTVNTATGYADAKTTSPAVVTNSNNSAAQNITLTFAEDANKDYDVTATFGLMTVSSWAWTLNSAAIPDPLNLYVGQSARLDVAYTPAGVDNSKKTYTRTKEDAYINWVGGLQATYSTISGKASTGENTTAVTFTHADGPTTTVNVKVLPLPAVHFGDIVHNVSFDDVVATLSDNTLSPTKTTPTHADFDGSTANTCEEQHLHLVGWIREDWPALVTYLNGTGDAPSTEAIVGAGNDGSGNAYFFTPGASINTQTFNV